MTTALWLLAAFAALLVVGKLVGIVWRWYSLAKLAELPKPRTVHVWDGVGPRRRCLLRLVYRDGWSDWSEYTWEDEDGDDEIDGNPHPERYAQESTSTYIARKGDRFVPNFDCTVTHWAEVPELEP